MAATGEPEQPGLLFLALIPETFGNSPLAEATPEPPRVGFTRGATPRSFKRSSAAVGPRNQRAAVR